VSKKHESPVNARAIENIFSSKIGPTPRFDESEAAAIAEYQRALTERQWAESIRTLNDDLKHELQLLLAAQDDESLRRTLDLRRPVPPQIVEQSKPQKAHLGALEGLPLPGCGAHLTSPPYTTGDPLVEEVGSNATVNDSGLSLAPGFNVLKTFSQLALPEEGALSLGVGLGKFRIANTVLHTVHPASIEIPFPIGTQPGLLEANRASASIGYFLASIPGTPIGKNTEMNLTVDVTLGDPLKPFYLVIAPVPFLWVQAFGVAHLIVISSHVGGSGVTATASQVRFLEHREAAGGPIFPPIVSREFSMSQKLTLKPGAGWVYVGIEIRLEVQRWFIVTIPPTEDRQGFAIIDLRSSEHNTQNIHYILGPRGPVRVPQISMTFCREQVFA